MNKSKRTQRRAAFVFGPPAILMALGAVLIAQSLTSGAVSANQQSASAPSSQLAAGQVLFNLDAIDCSKHSTHQAGSIWVVSNKHRPLNPLNYEPQNLRKPQSSGWLDNSRGLLLAEPAAAALEQMADEMGASGAGKLFVNSAHRSYANQAQIFDSKVSQHGLAEALIRSAKPGFSEHQTGLAVDVSVPAQGCAIMACFGQTEGGLWLANNAWKHGYIIRYPEAETETTGFTYEPWHLRYIGKELAKVYADGGIKTLEQLWLLPPAQFYLPEITSSTMR